MGKDGAMLIDYIAFFPTQEDAKLYHTDVEISNIGEGGQLFPGTYRFHAGDVLSLHTEMTEAGELAGFSPAGVSYQLFDHKNGLFLNDGDSENYINDALGFELSTIGRDGNSRGYYYVFEPTFTETANAVTVLVEDEDLPYFNTSSGIFDTEGNHLAFQRRTECAHKRALHTVCFPGGQRRRSRLEHGGGCPAVFWHVLLSEHGRERVGQRGPPDRGPRRTTRITRCPGRCTPTA